MTDYAQKLTHLKSSWNGAKSALKTSLQRKHVFSKFISAQARFLQIMDFHISAQTQRKLSDR
tara:strand:+ start:1223 stop:1408 length:186 start_codon:yes stop_codon:yes gene_type:complete